MAEVAAIRKQGTDKGDEIKSYRPISLLPIFRKAIETIINIRLDIETKNHQSDKQYGFVKNKSTLMAIKSLLRWHDIQVRKHTLTIFLDISGAFDNLKWSVLYEDLERTGCSKATRSIITDYLKERTAMMNLGGHCCTVRLTKGCPQGSILGPSLRNITIEELLSQGMPADTHIQAYADDIALSVAADSRIKLRRLVEEQLDRILIWGKKRELTFSDKKSIAVPFKGGLVPGFSIRFGTKEIKTMPYAKYLRVYLDQKLNYSQHINSIKEKNMDLFTRLRGTYGKDWGIATSNLSILYNRVFLPRIMYGASIWWKATTTHNNGINPKKSVTWYDECLSYHLDRGPTSTGWCTSLGPGSKGPST